MIFKERDWELIHNQTPRSYRCGFSSCNKEVSSEKGWRHLGSSGSADGWIYVCPGCKNPTFFDLTSDEQVPGIAAGSKVDHLPTEINNLWEEIRRATSQRAYTSAVLAGRKLLMHIAVEQGAKPNLGFTDYVDYLTSNHYAPPNSKNWVDKIRSHGNEANHEIVIKSKEDAEEIIIFLEMLMRFIYEFPQRGTKPAPTK